MKRTFAKLFFLILAASVLLCGCMDPSEDRTDRQESETDGRGGAEPSTEDPSREIAALLARLERLEERLAELERAVAADASADLSDDAAFTYEITENGAVVTGWNGSGKTLTIPARLGGCSVTAIADGAFRNATLTSVTLPDGVTSVGWFAFSGCYALTTVSLPASVTNIGYGAFENCSAGLRFLCPSGSYAAKYAASYGIPVSSRAS